MRHERDVKKGMEAGWPDQVRPNWLNGQARASYV